MTFGVTQWNGLVGAIADHDTGKIFDWLIGELSYQGISDAVADGTSIGMGT